MSPEEQETHNKVKVTVNGTVNTVNEELDLGELYTDGLWLTNEACGLSTEPDGALVTYETSAAGRVRLVPRKRGYGQYTEMQGTPDWVLEIISLTSVDKDTRDLRKRYHQAGIPEYWLIDARGEEIDFQILVRRQTRHVAVSPKDGWYYSPVFGRSFRLERRVNRAGRWQYKLLVKAD